MESGMELREKEWMLGVLVVCRTLHFAWKGHPCAWMHQLDDLFVRVAGGESPPTSHSALTWKELLFVRRRIGLSRELAWGQIVCTVRPTEGGSQTDGEGWTRVFTFGWEAGANSSVYPGRAVCAEEAPGRAQDVSWRHGTPLALCLTGAKRCGASYHRFIEA